MEALARQEHDRWIDDLVRDGWTYSSGTKDPGHKTHPLLIGWDDLDEPEREKDRDAIRAIPRMLARVGYALDVRRLDEDRDVPQPGRSRLREVDVRQQLVHAHVATQLSSDLDDLGRLGVAHPAVLRQCVRRRAVEVHQPAVIIVARNVRSADVHRPGQGAIFLDQLAVALPVSRRARTDSMPARAAWGFLKIRTTATPVAIARRNMVPPVSEAAPVGVPFASSGPEPRSANAATGDPRTAATTCIRLRNALSYGRRFAAHSGAAHEARPMVGTHQRIMVRAFRPFLAGAGAARRATPPQGRDRGRE